MDTPPVLLQASAVAKHFGAVAALSSAELTVQAGEIHALLGANGAGKSTLVKILSGVFPADGGQLKVYGEPVSFERPRDALAAGMATVFQDPALIGDLSVNQNMQLTGIDRAKMAHWLGRLELGDVDLDILVKSLPLETLRLLDLARALANDPQLLLLDEITAALPADQAARVFEVMREWKDRGRSVLFITHRLAEVQRHCDTATILRDGSTAAVVAPQRGGEQELIEAMLGSAAVGEDERESRGPVDGREVVLEAKDLHSARGDVRGASFTLHAGEILGIVALEGQGQQRLFDFLAGDRRPQSGEILVEGTPLNAWSPYDAIGRGVVLVPSDRLQALFPKQPVRDNLTIPLYARALSWLGLAKDEKERADTAIERLDIDIRAQDQVRRLSGGNQQKVVLGRWLASGFHTLLCFDPTRGIDLQTKRQIYGLLREIADQGKAVLLYTSELQEIPLVCDRVLVLYGGQFVYADDAAGATEEVLLAASHGLVDA